MSVGYFQLFPTFVRLKIWWCEVFPASQLPDMPIDDYPMLIGVMEHATGDQGDFFPFGHQCQVLQRCDLLPQSGQRSSLALVLKALMTFKERWHLSRQFLLPFDIGQSTGLCPDVLVEIAKYLSLNDAIHAFSISILSVLRQAHSKIHLNDPSRQFLEIIPDQLDSRQVASVRMSGDLQRSERDLSAFQIFDQLSNLTVVSERGTHTLSQLLRYLPSIRRLSSMPHKVEGRHNSNRYSTRIEANREAISIRQFSIHLFV